MKKQLIIKVCLLLSLMAVSVNLSAHVPSIILNPAEKLTEKGFVDKESTFNPAALDSLLKCDEYVMLIVSYKWCNPCEKLRISDIFDRYPITPYYIDYKLNEKNRTLLNILPSMTGVPTCLYFDPKGEIVAVTSGIGDLYEKLDRIVKDKERICEYAIEGVPADRILPLLNCSYKANAAYLKGDMEGMCKYATAAMEIHPDFYNKYLLYKYYISKNDEVSANKYKALALENLSETDTKVYKEPIAELKR